MKLPDHQIFRLPFQSGFQGPVNTTSTIILARIGKGTLPDYGTNGNTDSGIIHRQGEIRLNDNTNKPPVFRNKYSI